MTVSNTKLVKVNDSFEVTICNNGYVLTVSGRDDKEDWKSAKIVCSNLEQLFDLIAEIDETERE